LAKWTDSEFLIRLNSEYFYRTEPHMLQTVFVSPHNSTIDGANELLHVLKEQSFVDSIYTELVESDLVDQLNMMNGDSSKTHYVIIELQKPFQSIDQINWVCQELERIPGVEGAAFNDLYTGIFETESFFLINSNENNR